MVIFSLKNVKKLSHMVKNCKKNCQHFSKIFKNIWKWSKMVKNGKNGFRSKAFPTQTFQAKRTRRLAHVDKPARLNQNNYKYWDGICRAFASLFCLWLLSWVCPLDSFLIFCLPQLQNHNLKWILILLAKSKHNDIWIL